MKLLYEIILVILQAILCLSLGQLLILFLYSKNMLTNPEAMHLDELFNKEPL